VVYLEGHVEEERRRRSHGGSCLDDTQCLISVDVSAVGPILPKGRFVRLIKIDHTVVAAGTPVLIVVVFSPVQIAKTGIKTF
jgi:hypothetical protein